LVGQEKIYNQCLSDDPKERIKALNKLKSNFSLLADKQQAWEDVHRLTSDQDLFVRSSAAEALYSVFSHLPDKQQAWNDLIRLTIDQEFFVKSRAASVLGSVFSYVPDKQQAWNDLIKLTSDKDRYVKFRAASSLGSAFSYVPDKQQAWEDLHRLASDKDCYVKSGVASSLGSAFSYVPDKQQAWEDLHRLASDKDRYVKSSAASSLGSVFSHLPDKQQAWNDLIGLTTYQGGSVRYGAVHVLGSAFSYVPDKQRAWEDLHRLASDKDRSVRYLAVYAFRSAFSHLPDKKQAWNYLIRLTSDKDRYVSSEAFYALGSAFSYVPDKQQAWNDLIRLATYQGGSVRYLAVYALRSAFSYVPDKQQAWNDLIRLASDKDRYVAFGAINALAFVFSHLPDKQQAWNDLISDQYLFVRYETASILGSVFSYVPDKQQAWNDLIRLTSDEDSNVRTYANHSLGKVSIFQASQAEKEEDYKNELEKAIEFFEKSAQESSYWSNPSQFCLPFYRSFHSIIFKKQESKEEVDKYLAEAKDAVGGSKSKELLFESVENLSNALKEVQDLGNLDFEAKKCELSFYRKYCDHAAELMKDADEKAPHATGVLRKGLPILDRNLKGIIEEIQKKAKIACQVSQGTLTQEIACSVNKHIQKWEIGSQEEMTFYVESFIFTLESKIPRLPENEHIFTIINESKDQKDLKKLLKNTSELIEIIPEITIDPERMKPTIGIITALPKEYVAVNILLENRNDKFKIPGHGAGRRYCLGEILSEEGNKHNLVLATAGMGNNIAATRASLLLEHFPNVKSIIMVGIAGGIPNPKKADDHVRLGDIVVSDEKGVVQYDLIKQAIQEITYRNPPRPPSASLLEAVKYLEVEEILGNRPWEKYIDQALSKLRTTRPSEDILYSSENQEIPIEHPEDPRRIKDKPRIFLGPIGSANILQKDPNARDKLREKFGIKAIEMEASGIADATWNHEASCLVVRGICDYCDSHKNDDWQQYAAVVAAAYTRALIESMP